MPPFRTRFPRDVVAAAMPESMIATPMPVESVRWSTP
jgi:hypothetical protein